MDTSWIYHDSHLEEFRSPFGAIKEGESVSLSININDKESIECVLLKYHFKDDYKVYQMELVKDWSNTSKYEVKFKVPSEIGLLWYYFIVIKDSKVYYYGNNDHRRGGIGKIHSTVPKSFQITVYDKDFVTPKWFKNEIMYQIFVDRFNHLDDERTDAKSEILKNKTNIIHACWDEKPRYVRTPGTMDVIGYDFFGGNFKGIIEKLDYLKSLNIGVIYLNPIFKSVSNHKYDTGDYNQVDLAFGSMESFDDLVEESKKRNIKIILDGVFSHTGSDSVYFNKEGNYQSVGAYNSKESPYYSWYRFLDYPNKYESWWGFETLPNVNELDPNYQDFIAKNDDSVIKRWIRSGVMGWRLDVADELPDEFIDTIRDAIKEANPDGVLIGEVWEDASNKVSYGVSRNYILGKGLDSVTNYPFRTIMIDFLLFRKKANEASAEFLSLLENYPKEVTYSLMNLLGSHDTERILTLLGEAPIHPFMSLDEIECYKLKDDNLQLGIKRLKLMSLIQMTYPGVPCIYYGDEVGLEGYKDPHNRGTYPWGKENVELLEWFTTLTSIRKDYDCLSVGKIMFIDTHEDILCYARCTNNGEDVFGNYVESHTGFIIINRSTTNEYTISINTAGCVKSNILEDVLNGCDVYDAMSGVFTVTIKPLGYKLLIG